MVEMLFELPDISFLRHILDPGLRALVTQWLVKDPADRGTATSALQTSYFQGLARPRGFSKSLLAPVRKFETSTLASSRSFSRTEGLVSTTRGTPLLASNMDVVTDETAMLASVEPGPAPSELTSTRSWGESIAETSDVAGGVKDVTSQRKHERHRLSRIGRWLLSQLGGGPEEIVRLLCKEVHGGDRTVLNYQHPADGTTPLHQPA